MSEDIKDLDLTIGDKVWIMVADYPYEVEVLRISEYKGRPRGTHQKDFAYLWRIEKDTTHKRYTWQIWKTQDDLIKHLFPKLNI